MKKVIFLTGASRGIGRAIAIRLASDNHNLVLFSRNTSDLESLQNEIKQSGPDCSTLIIPGDVTNEDAVRNAIQKTVDNYGTIDCVINNAGIGSFKRIDQFSVDEFKLIQDVNLLGTFLVTKFASPVMIESKKGQFINIASVAGLTGFKYGTAYAASKFAMVGFSESLREDLKEFGIAVAVVCPGGVRTGFGGGNPDKMDREYLLEPDDVARTVQYLVNESETANAKLIELKPRKRPEKR